jgi:exopolysaccharide biosynthesis polyprenyl glycosylphosphotransferase
MSVVQTNRQVVGAQPYADGASAARLRGEVRAWQARYRRGVLLIDVGCAGAAAVAAFAVRFGAPASHLDAPAGSHLVAHLAAYAVASLAFPAVWVLVLGLLRAHEPRFLFEGTEEYRKVIAAGAVVIVSVALVSYGARAQIARGWLMTLVLVATLSTLLLRYAWRKQLHRRRWQQGTCMRRALIVGYERATANLCATLQRDRYHGLQVVGACLPERRIPGPPKVIADCGVPVVGSFVDVDVAVANTGADTVVVLACPELDGLALRRLGWKLEKTETTLLVAPALLDVAGPRTTVRPVADLPLLHVEHIELTGWRRLLKNAFDRVAATLLLIVLSPFLLALAAVLKLGDGGPVFFRQTRVGHDGREFQMLKFRTMVVDAEDRLAELLTRNDGDGVLFKIRADPRITALGRFLRRYSLDELPQLVNVLRGEMSLVGPRPPLPREVERYEDDVHRRFAVRPGITGLWQVSGRSDLPWEEAVRLDIRYVERWSLLLDMLIICRTLGAVLRRTGAY